MDVLKKNPSVLSGHVGDHYVLFNLNDRQLHVLNITGAAAWDRLDCASTTSGLASQLARDFGVAANDIRSDLDGLLALFRQSGLCVTADDGATLDQRSGVGSDETVHLPNPALMPQIARARSLLGPFMALSIPVTVAVGDDALARDLDQILDPLRCRLEDFDAAEIAIEIVVDAPSLERSAVDATGREMWVVQVSGKPPQRFRSRDRVIRQVVAEVNGTPLEHLDNAVVFHAAAAEFDPGVVLFPGVSNAGKSTLITQLIHRGHSYVTDEAAMVPIGSNQVEAFPKSITIEPASQIVIEGLIPGFRPGTSTVDLDPRLIGQGILSRGGPIAAMIFPTYRPNVTTELTALNSFEAFQALLANAFVFDRAGQCAFDTIVELANEIPAFALDHGGDADHLDVIEQTVAGVCAHGATRPGSSSGFR